MGKTKRILNKARKEYFKQLESTINKEISNSDSEDDFVEEESYEIKLDRLSFRLRKMIFDYVKEEALPICEYLNIENMTNYLNWVIKKS